MNFAILIIWKQRGVCAPRRQSLRCARRDLRSHCACVEMSSRQLRTCSGGWAPSSWLIWQTDYVDPKVRRPRQRMRIANPLARFGGREEAGGDDRRCERVVMHQFGVEWDSGLKIQFANDCQSVENRILEKCLLPRERKSGPKWRRWLSIFDSSEKWRTPLKGECTGFSNKWLMSEWKRTDWVQLWCQRYECHFSFRFYIILSSV